MLISSEKMREKGLYWHYTTWQGLEGILKSRALWATNFAYLNDSQELAYAARLMQKVLGDVDEKFSDEMVRGWRRAKPVWITSFSTAFDSLSQWRAYTTGTKTRKGLLLLASLLLDQVPSRFQQL